MTTIAKEARGDLQRYAVLSPDVVARLRDLLEGQRRALLQRATEFVDDIEVLQTPTATHGQGESEQANRHVELGMAVQLETNTRAALADVESALARVDDGSFGVCAACGGPIGFERLMAVPETRYCVGCQQRCEVGERGGSR